MNRPRARPWWFLVAVLASLAPACGFLFGEPTTAEPTPTPGPPRPAAVAPVGIGASGTPGAVGTGAASPPAQSTRPVDASLVGTAVVTSKTGAIIRIPEESLVLRRGAGTFSRSDASLPLDDGTTVPFGQVESFEVVGPDAAGDLEVRIAHRNKQVVGGMIRSPRGGNRLQGKLDVGEFDLGLNDVARVEFDRSASRPRAGTVTPSPTPNASRAAAELTLRDGRIVQVDHLSHVWFVPMTGTRREADPGLRLRSGVQVLFDDMATLEVLDARTSAEGLLEAVTVRVTTRSGRTVTEGARFHQPIYLGGPTSVGDFTRSIADVTRATFRPGAASDTVGRTAPTATPRPPASRRGATITLPDGATVRVQRLSHEWFVPLTGTQRFADPKLSLKSGRSINFDDMRGFEVVEVTKDGSRTAAVKLKLTSRTSDTVVEEVATPEMHLHGPTELGEFSLPIGELQKVEFEASEP